MINGGGCDQFAYQPRLNGLVPIQMNWLVGNGTGQDAAEVATNISRGLTQMQSLPVFIQISEKYLMKGMVCDDNQDKDIAEVRLEIQHLLGLFVITLAGLGVALLGAAGQRAINGPKKNVDEGEGSQLVECALNSDKGSPPEEDVVDVTNCDVAKSEEDARGSQSEGGITMSKDALSQAYHQLAVMQADSSLLKAFAAAVVAELSEKELPANTAEEAPSGQYLFGKWACEGRT